MCLQEQKYCCFTKHWVFFQCNCATKLGIFNKTLQHFKAVCGNKTDYFQWVIFQLCLYKIENFLLRHEGIFQLHFWQQNWVFFTKCQDISQPQLCNKIHYLTNLIRRHAILRLFVGKKVGIFNKTFGYFAALGDKIILMSQNTGPFFLTVQHIQVF